MQNLPSEHLGLGLGSHPWNPINDLMQIFSLPIQKKKKVPAAITRAFDHIACKLEEIEGSQDKDMRLMSCEKA